MLNPLLNWRFLGLYALFPWERALGLMVSIVSFISAFGKILVIVYLLLWIIFSLPMFFQNLGEILMLLWFRRVIIQVWLVIIAPFRSPRMIMKIDIEKACDTIKWDAILATLHRMDFPLTWISWVKSCISSARFSLLSMALLLIGLILLGESGRETFCFLISLFSHFRFWLISWIKLWTYPSFLVLILDWFSIKTTWCMRMILFWSGKLIDKLPETAIFVCLLMLG